MSSNIFQNTDIEMEIHKFSKDKERSSMTFKVVYSNEPTHMAEGNLTYSEIVYLKPRIPPGKFSITFIIFTNINTFSSSIP
jgi:hypothetical protein